MNDFKNKQTVYRKLLFSDVFIILTLIEKFHLYKLNYMEINIYLKWCHFNEKYENIYIIKI